VAAAVILRTRRLAVPIDDSKRLTRGQRARAYDAILAHADVGFGISPPEEIDDLNILQATLLAMQRAVQDLRLRADLVLVDGPTPLPPPTPCWPLIGGDRRSCVIACASIMAKEFRDRLMERYHRLCPAYAFDRHKGYGTALHAERLRLLGPSVFHRRSFRPVRDTEAQNPACGRATETQRRPLRNPSVSLWCAQACSVFLCFCVMP
jgi:ribonuclease HII